MQEYQHRPVDTKSSEIRLLRIEKSTDSTPTIVLTLRHANLEDGEQFNALSYAWGEEHPTYEVLLRDDNTQGYIRIRKHLFEFLRAARTSTANWSMEWIWIDQICINQSDHTERCHQVDQMAKLYSTAQATIVWPGSTDSHPDQENGEAGLSRFVFDPGDLKMIRSTPIDLHKYRQVPTVPSKSAMRLLDTVSNNLLIGPIFAPYWRRLWIIQEIVLATRVLILIEGEVWEEDDVHSVVEILLININHLKMTKSEKDQLSFTRGQLTLITFQRQIRQFQYASAQQGKEMCNLNGWDIVLLMGAGTHCTVPFDRIYAVMGLLLEDLRVHSDYTISPKELLKAILQKQMSQKQMSVFVDRLGGMWEILNRILKIWMGIAGFQLLQPAGWIPEPPGDFYNLDDWARLPTIEHNVSLVLRELDIPLPTELEAACWRGEIQPIKQHAQDSVAEKRKRRSSI